MQKISIIGEKMISLGVFLRVISCDSQHGLANIQIVLLAHVYVTLDRLHIFNHVSVSNIYIHIYWIFVNPLYYYSFASYLLFL